MYIDLTNDPLAVYSLENGDLVTVDGMKFVTAVNKYDEIYFTTLASMFTDPGEIFYPWEHVRIGEDNAVVTRDEMHKALRDGDYYVR